MAKKQWREWYVEHQHTPEYKEAYSKYSLECSRQGLCRLPYKTWMYSVWYALEE